jgi:hypothetical protein
MKTQNNERGDVMKKKSKKMDWKSWGVEDLIPERVLKRMVATPGFDVNYVRKAAESHLGRIAWSYSNMELYKEILECGLRRLRPDSSGDNVLTLGGFLEYAFIIKFIENKLREQIKAMLN